MNAGSQTRICICEAEINDAPVVESNDDRYHIVACGHVYPHNATFEVSLRDANGAAVNATQSSRVMRNWKRSNAEHFDWVAVFSLAQGQWEKKVFRVKATSSASGLQNDTAERDLWSRRRRGAPSAAKLRADWGAVTIQYPLQNGTFNSNDTAYGVLDPSFGPWTMIGGWIWSQGQCFLGTFQIPPADANHHWECEFSGVATGGGASITIQARSVNMMIHSMTHTGITVS